MIQIHHLSKSYGVNTVLTDINFQVGDHDRIGLVGVNGCGKSTMLRILSGEELPDQGDIICTRQQTIGYIPQGNLQNTEKDVSQFLWSANPSLDLARQRTSDFEQSLASGDESLQALQAYGEALETFERLGGYEMSHRIEVVMSGLGLGHVGLDEEISKLSGGEYRRLCLASLLLTRPDFLLLDEPTNHLDLDAMVWLEGFLNSYQGAALVVSHDRTFLDHTVNRILELDIHTHTLIEYAGNYSDYEFLRQTRIEKTWQAWYDQRAEIRRVEQDIQRTKQQAIGVETQTKNDFVRGIAKKVAKKAKSREKKLERYVDSLDRVERPPKQERLKMDFENIVRSGDEVLRLSDIGHQFSGQTIFSQINASVRYGDRIALMGKNGCGKTTLLRLITGELKPSQGILQLGTGVRLGYMPQHHEDLPMDRTPFDVIKDMKHMPDSEVFNFLHNYLIFGNQVRLPIKDLSYGERARFYLAQMVLKGANFLVLDEPINHLDIPSRQQFENALQSFPGTVLMTLHDRSFIAGSADLVWNFKDQRLFMSSPKKLLGAIH